LADPRLGALFHSIQLVLPKTEWKGTEITFEVSKKGDKTEVRFTHLGLVPESECFDACSNAWGSYINGSLRSLITTGKGEPKQKEKGGGEKVSLPLRDQSNQVGAMMRSSAQIL
jgi:hypothetical protein